MPDKNRGTDGDGKLQEKKTVVKKVLVPDAVDKGGSIPSPLTMDGTAHTEISIMQNLHYSSEIIQAARDSFNLKKLIDEKKIGKENFLREGERQIFRLWHSIVALETHSTMFIVLFLVSIGEILNEIKATLKPHEFAEWRRKTFHYKHERYLQQAQQLSKMGFFAKQYASIGKKRLLALDHLKKESGASRHEELFKDYEIPKEMRNSLLTKYALQKNPFPDSTEDLGGDLLQEHVDARLTHSRLEQAGIKFATFDQARLIAAFNKNAITLKHAIGIKKWLDQRSGDKKKWFDILIMDKMVLSEIGTRPPTSGDSLNKVLANLVSHCRTINFQDATWKSTQDKFLEKDLLIESYGFLRRIGQALNVKIGKK